MTGNFRKFTLVEIMIVVAVIGILMAMAIPSFVHARTESRKRVCIANLKEMAEAKSVWALEKQKVNGDSVTFSDLVPSYLKATPECPSGGTYTLGAVGVTPTCSISGHRLAGASAGSGGGGGAPKPGPIPAPSPRPRPRPIGPPVRLPPTPAPSVGGDHGGGKGGKGTGKKVGDGKKKGGKKGGNKRKERNKRKHKGKRKNGRKTNKNRNKDSGRQTNTGGGGVWHRLFPWMF